VLSVLRNWLWLLVGFWVYPVGPILGLGLLAALSGHWSESFKKQYPTISAFLFVFALASCFAHVVLGWWWSREWRKNRDAYAAARAKEQAEFIQSMQEVSYWLDGTTKAEGAICDISIEVITMADRLARKRVEQEISKKGFKITDVSLREIRKAARALLAAQRPQMIEQARAMLEEMKVRGRRTAR
jgi:hypothetical protein